MTTERDRPGAVHGPTPAPPRTIAGGKDAGPQRERGEPVKWPEFPSVRELEEEQGESGPPTWLDVDLATGKVKKVKGEPSPKAPKG